MQTEIAWRRFVFPSPLVGEGGLARSAKTVEGVLDGALLVPSWNTPHPTELRSATFSPMFGLGTSRTDVRGHREQFCMLSRQDIEVDGFYFL
ncbi:hypothetical protein NKI59_24745, partial [Mesorhizobium sp. M0598]|uniref:hypothetical protein n=1 Tax=Mesorhizobium sp. M0598 TaxID=2956968 RepID=UPI00333666A5